SGAARGDCLVADGAGAVHRSDRLCHGRRLRVLLHPGGPGGARGSSEEFVERHGAGEVYCRWRLAVAPELHRRRGDLRRLHLLDQARRWAPPIAGSGTDMISVVIPVFNEQDSLAVLHGEIARAAQSASLQLEVLFIDDGSTDGSWDIIRSLAEQHADV